ncbi:hypothetical protein TrVE_jg14426 [Triparma verrucosa]|uniref:Uncharacterized protein n=1 Tax=Triparma verrucosa TaxID=1606542 RepID=A0A9W7EZP0_9STRA|nr:hypothetical protein TrVE_jg14426 [Triparma verrucosa]
MGQSVSSKVHNFRQSLVKPLESALLKKDALTRSQVLADTALKKSTAQSLGTKYTDPSALITGFRRDEHSKISDNDQFLRYNQGLSSGPSHGVLEKREEGEKEYSPEMIKFMYDLGEAKTPKIRGPEQEHREQELKSRPMPTSKLKVGPRTVDSRAAGILDGETLKKILLELDGENSEELQTNTSGGIRKKNRLSSLSSSKVSSLIDSESTATKYGFTKEEIEVIHRQLCTPRVVVEKMTGDVKGVWRDVGIRIK